MTIEEARAYLSAFGSGAIARAVAVLEAEISRLEVEVVRLEAHCDSRDVEIWRLQGRR